MNYSTLKSSHSEALWKIGALEVKVNVPTLLFYSAVFCFHDQSPFRLEGGNLVFSITS